MEGGVAGGDAGFEGRWWRDRFVSPRLVRVCIHGCAEKGRKSDRSPAQL